MFIVNKYRVWKYLAYIQWSGEDCSYLVPF